MVSDRFLEGHGLTKETLEEGLKVIAKEKWLDE